MARTGVLITGFGGPDSLDAVVPFMTNLMGREPSAELAERIRRRYLAIGGASPLVSIASSLAEKLESAFAETGLEVPVRIGMAYWHPLVAQGLADLVALGCTRVVVLSLSPYESKASSGACRDAVCAASGAFDGLEIVEAPLISELPEFVDYLAGGCATAITDIKPSEGAIVAFTAHSLPVSDLVEDDPYVAGLRRTAEAVAEQLGMSAGHEGAGEGMLGDFRAYGTTEYPRAWFLVYQSKGARGGEWLGPDLDELIEAASGSLVKALVVCPIGFVTDHMETMYDLDIDAAGKALDAGLEFMRSPVPNDEPSLVAGIVKAVAPLI